MINGNPNSFIDTIYSCQDIVFIYDKTKYWFQGYTIDTGFHMEIFQYEPTTDGYVWEHNDDTLMKCVDAFLSAPIFNGKTFWDAEQEIEWVDD